MDVKEMTFGVEIETTIPAGCIPVGGYHRGIQAQGLPEGWTATQDGSIRASRGRMGCEFVSPVLKGEAGLESVIAAVAAIKAMGGQVNSSCGLHVHVGFDRSNEQALQRLVILAANHEKAIYASTGTKSREQGNYCRGIQRHGSADAVISNRGHEARYHLLNLTNLLNGGKPTVEFRAFAGTLNVEKIFGAIRLSLGLVERAYTAKRVAPWVAKPVKESSPIHRSGEGQTALTRLFYQLGWIKGRTDHTFGNLSTTAAPTLPRIKKTLMKLARKYDGQ